jgi:glycosyltransferase involved in cell wall biosynthesis
MPMANLRITLLTTGLAYGGAESQLVRLASGLKHKGLTIEVVSMTEPKEYVKELKDQSINVISLGMKPGTPDPRAVVALAKTIEVFQPDILHSHMIHANILGRIVRLLRRFPVQISTAHSINEGGKLRQLMYRITDNFCDLTTNVSQAAVARYIEASIVPPNKIRYVPNGVDTQIFKPNLTERQSIRRELGLNNNFVWLAVGRFDPAKDHETMVSAFSTVSKDYPKSRLLLVGDGQLQIKIQEMVKELGLIDKVSFLGTRKDISRLMNGADGYLMSSAWEGLPMVLLEACACGLPSVTTDVGGTSEIIEQGKNGFLAKPRDPRSLAQAMDELMKLPAAQLQQLGNVGRSRVLLDYSFDTVIEKWEAIYIELLNRRTSGRE